MRAKQWTDGRVVLVGFLLCCLLHLPAAFAQQSTVMLDMSAAFNTDVVWRTSSSPLNGVVFNNLCEFDTQGRCYVSRSLAVANASPASAGLPDNGLVPTDGVNFPNVQLAPFETAGLNVWMGFNPNDALALNLAQPAQYNFVHVFTSSGGFDPNNPPTLRVRLSYADGTNVDSAVLASPDWFGPGSGSSYFLLNGLDRTDFGVPVFAYDAASQSGVADAAIFGLRVPVDNTRLLSSVTVTTVSISNSVMAVFGVMATTFGGPTPPVLGPVQVPSLSTFALVALAGLMSLSAWRMRRGGR